MTSVGGCGGPLTDDDEPRIAELRSPLTAVHQAEAAFDVDEGVIESEHAGFTGTGYVNINNFSNTFMWHIVESPIATSAALRVRYANGTSSSRPIQVTVNGSGGVVAGAPTGAWTSWVVSEVVPIFLQAGDNDVFHSSVIAAGMPNIDRFEIDQTCVEVIEAEAAFDIDEGEVESQYAGFSGAGYVNINNFSNTFMWHIVESAIAGPATLRVRYANGSNAARPISISVNGADGGTLAGDPTGTWTNWVTSELTGITLAEGGNDVIHSSVVAAGMPNIDRFEIDRCSQIVQAESAFDIDEGVVEAEHAGFTGTGYVNIDNFSNTFTWHIVESPVAGPAMLRIRYANGTGSNRPIQVTVNGVNAGSVNGSPTGSWTTWVTSPALSINLAAGSNDVIHSSVVAAGMPNIDRFEITR